MHDPLSAVIFAMPNFHKGKYFWGTLLHNNDRMVKTTTMPTIYGQSVRQPLWVRTNRTCWCCKRMSLIALHTSLPYKTTLRLLKSPPFNQFIQLDWAGIPSDHDHDDPVENDHRLQTKLSEFHGGRSSRPLRLRLNFLTPSRCFNMRLKQRCSNIKTREIQTMMFNLLG